MSDHQAARCLFDAEWYRARYPVSAQEDPFEHYCRIGAASGYDPNPVFDTKWYCGRYRSAPDQQNPLIEFLRRGAAADNDPGPLFSTRWYLASNPDVAKAGINPLEHYLTWSATERRDPSPVFDSAWYFATYPDIAAGLDARAHYMSAGAAAGYDPSPWFSTRWYSEMYPEVADTQENPLLHYLTSGARAGYDPSSSFGTAAYADAHPECLLSGENPLVHYLIERHLGRPQTATAAGMVSSLALEVTRALLERFADTEIDLDFAPELLPTLPNVPIAPDPYLLTWRGLYLSLVEPPDHVVLVGRIDGDVELPRHLGVHAGLLVLETDTDVASTAELLPRGTNWRSLAEFAPHVEGEYRLRIVSALVNSLAPRSVTVWGSRIGWDFLVRHGAAVQHHAKLRAATVATAEIETPELLRRYLRTCLPVLTGLYDHDQDRLAADAARYGLPPSAFGKLHRLADLAAAIPDSL